LNLFEDFPGKIHQKFTTLSTLEIESLSETRDWIMGLDRRGIEGEKFKFSDFLLLLNLVRLQKACDDCWECRMTLMNCETAFWWSSSTYLIESSSVIRESTSIIISFNFQHFLVILLAFCDLFHHSSHKGVSLLSRKQKHLFSTAALSRLFFLSFFIRNTRKSYY
jgi:hypothetical protein